MPTPIILNGLNGRSYRFDLYPLHGTVFHRVPGVYVAMRSGAFGYMEHLYVGEAEDLYQRLITDRPSHSGLQCAIRRGATHIAATIISDRSVRLNTETQLRHSLNPPCNKQGLGLFS